MGDCLPTLPQELYDQIVDAVAHDHPASLVICNQTSRVFRGRAQLHLYRTVTVYLSNKRFIQRRLGGLYIHFADFVVLADVTLSAIRTLTIHLTCTPTQLRSAARSLLEREWHMDLRGLKLAGSIPWNSPSDVFLVQKAVRNVAYPNLQCLDVKRFVCPPFPRVLDIVTSLISLRHLVLRVDIPGPSSLAEMPRRGGHLESVTLELDNPQLRSSLTCWTTVYIDRISSNAWYIDMIFLVVSKEIYKVPRHECIRGVTIICGSMPKLDRQAANVFADRTALNLIRNLPRLSLLHFHLHNAKPARCDLAAVAARTLYHRRTKYPGQSVPQYLVLTMTLRERSDLLQCLLEQDWDYLCDELSMTSAPILPLVIIAVPCGAVVHQTELRRDVETAIHGKDIEPSSIVVCDSARWTDGRLHPAKMCGVIRGSAADLRVLAEM